MPVFIKPDGFAFWWMMDFIRNGCVVPNAEGLAVVLRMAHKFDIKPIALISHTVSVLPAVDGMV